MQKLLGPINFFVAKAPILQSIVLLAIRLWLASVFLKSGILKIQSWETTISLFTDEYHLPFIPPIIAAVLGTIVEVGAGVCLVIGLFTPLAALALFFLTLTIELFVYPGTNDHYHWMLLLGVLIAFGAGKISLDAPIFDKLKRAQNN